MNTIYSIVNYKLSFPSFKCFSPISVLKNSSKQNQGGASNSRAHIQHEKASSTLYPLPQHPGCEIYKITWGNLLFLFVLVGGRTWPSLGLLLALRNHSCQDSENDMGILGMEPINSAFFWPLFPPFPWTRDVIQ